MRVLPDRAPRGARGLLLLAALLVGSALARVAPARAAGSEEARAYNDKATAAFALGRYAEAADYFEKAFELKPDPALLYNAAQAHRMAGNKERALALYQNYLRVYGAKAKRPDIESRIEELKKAIEHDKEVATAPPTNTLPIENGGPAEPSAPVVPVAPANQAPSAPPGAPAAGVAATAPVLVAQPASNPSGEEKSIVQKPWFWVAIGGGVAAAVVVALLLTMGGSKNPSPSLGVLN